MFNASIQKSALEQFIDAATALVEEGKIHLNDDRMWLRAVGAANVGMVNEHLNAEAFGSYGVDPDDGEDVLIGVDLRRLGEIVSLGSADDSVHLALDDDHAGLLSVRVGNKEFEIALIDTASIRSEPDIPDLELAGSARFEWRHFDDAISAAGMVSDHLEITAHGGDEHLSVEAAGDTDGVDVSLTSELESVSVDEECSSVFSVEYMESVSTGIPDDDSIVEATIGGEFPIRFSTSFLGSSVGSLEYTIAPRIETS
jgi:proliferating cell nuclear antigen